MAVVADETAILGAWSLYPGAPAARPMVVTYSFPATAPAYIFNLGPGSNFIAADATFRIEARNAIARVAAVAGVTFIETTDHVGDIVFGQYSSGPGGLSQGGANNPAGNATQPDADGAPHVIRGFYDGSLNNDVGFGGYVVAGTLLVPGIPTEHVLLRQLLSALGLKWAYFGEPTLHPLLQTALATIMADKPPFLAELGELDKLALWRIYGQAGNAGWQTDWSWDAASETMTQTATRDGVFVRGTNAADIVRVAARNAIVVTQGGNDTIEAAGQDIEIDAGPGDDTVSTGLAYTINTRVLPIDALGLAIEAAGVRQIVTRAEHLLFTNGAYNLATGRFEGELNLGAPALVRWTDYDTINTGIRGAISLAGPPGMLLDAYLNPQQLDTAYPVSTTPDGRGTTFSTPYAPYSSTNVTVAPLWVGAHSESNGVRTDKVLVAVYRTGTAAADTIDASADPAAMIDAGAGDDTIIGSPGDDLIRGSPGTDTVVYPGDLAQYRFGEYLFAASGNILRVAGPQGDDILVAVERLDFADTEPLTLAALRADGRMDELMPVRHTYPPDEVYVGPGSHLGFELPRAYVGPVGWLEREFIGGIDGETVGGTARADFIALAAGDDAIDAGLGDDVLDGGLGSNFLTGGAGRDVFFLDGRGGGATWSTITDWTAGEELALWGWQPGTSTASWRDLDGAPGWQGATLVADVAGATIVVTFAGRSRAQLPDPMETDGLLWFR